MKKNDTIIVMPDVKRITEGLRDTGYDVNTAIADLVDNSIAAGATFIDIRLEIRENGEPLFVIGDNGQGMNKEGLINCMRYGSPAKEVNRLGKFGLGLKTASTTFCRRFRVVSRASAKGKLLQAIWDLDNLAESGEWQLEMGKPEQDVTEYFNLCTHKGPGTVVIWEKVDRLLAMESTPEEAETLSAGKVDAHTRIKRIEKNLFTHLALVFQRYLDPNHDETHTIRIFINDTPVTPWDPFCTDVADGAGTHILTSTYGDDIVPLVVTASLLPRAETIENVEKRESLQQTTDRQGIYVYRENRLIHGPDWLGIHSPDPKWNLLRVSLSFDARMDKAFMVDIKKSQVLINEHLYAWLKNTFLPNLLQRAEERWLQGAAEKSQQTAETRHAVSDSTIRENIAGLRKAEVLESHLHNNTAQIRNNNGTTEATITVVDGAFPLRHIHPVAKKTNDPLLEPCFLNGQLAVTINTAHPFYRKVYLPNENNSPLVQALDMLFWSLAQAELNNVTEENQRHFTAMQAELSKNLTKLLHNLPE